MNHPTTERSLRARTLAALPWTLLLSASLVACSEAPDAEPPTAEICTDYEDEASPGATDFLVRNDSPDWIYLAPESCRSTVEPTISRDGEALDPMTGDCIASCGDLQEGGSYDCALACPAPFVIAIEPGGAYPLAWSGLYGVDQAMPSACYSDGSAASCTQRVAAEAGTFGVVVAIATSLECDGDCTCEPNAEGYCTIADLNALPTGAMPLEATFDFPASDAVELVWRQEAFINCPDELPVQGESCADAGTGVCTYDMTNACGQTLDPEASCDGTTWTVITNQPACLLECPATAPTAGEGCDPTTDGTFCRYGEAEACEQFTCDDATDSWSASTCE